MAFLYYIISFIYYSLVVDNIVYYKYMNFVSTKLIFAAVILFLFLVYWAFNFIIIYHLTRFGIGTQPKKFAAIFLFGSIILFFLSVFLFAGLDINTIKHQLVKVGNSAFNIKYRR